MNDKKKKDKRIDKFLNACKKSIDKRIDEIVIPILLKDHPLKQTDEYHDQIGNVLNLLKEGVIDDFYILGLPKSKLMSSLRVAYGECFDMFEDLFDQIIDDEYPDILDRDALIALVEQYLNERGFAHLIP